MIKYALFDMDGTLLPMKLEEFVKAYFSSLAKRLAPFGYDKEALIGAIWTGVNAMVTNDGNATNCEVFWRTFSKFFGEGVKEHIEEFNSYYTTDFKQVRGVCGFNADVAPAIKAIKAMGISPVLASNPLFPLVGQKERLSWTGASADDFVLFTSYENMHYCKPNPKYYEEILSMLGASAQECIMIGNDVEEDMVAKTLGIDVFLLPACLINSKNRDVSAYPQGDFNDLLKYIAARAR